MRSKGWVAPVTLAGLIVLLLGGIGWLANRGDSGSGGGPPLLHLAGGSAAADAAARSGAPDAGGGVGGAPYKLDGTLPAGQPGDQTLWRLRTATADDAVTVAAALGLDGTPTRVHGGWVLRHGDNLLGVREEGGWSYGLDCAPDAPISDEDLSVGCAVASSGGVAVAPVAPDAPTDGGSDSGYAPTMPSAAPTDEGGGSSSGSSGGSSGNGGGSTEPCNPETDNCVRDIPPPKPSPMPTFEPSPGPSEADARAAAVPILDRLGLGDAPVTVLPGDPTATVQAQPRVGALPTAGWTTSLQIDGSGDVVTANGWVGDPEAGDRYPVVTAQRAFELLQEQPRAMPDLCQLRKDGKPGCVEPAPVVITGAELGLMLDYDGQRAVLVPAWLFDVRGSAQPLAQVGIDPSYLASPVTPTGEPARDLPATATPVSGGPETYAPQSAPADQPVESNR